MVDQYLSANGPTINQNLNIKSTNWQADVNHISTQPSPFHHTFRFFTFFVFVFVFLFFFYNSSKRLSLQPLESFDANSDICQMKEPGCSVSITTWPHTHSNYYFLMRESTLLVKIPGYSIVKTSGAQSTLILS